MSLYKTLKQLSSTVNAVSANSSFVGLITTSFTSSVITSVSTTSSYLSSSFLTASYLTASQLSSSYLSASQLTSSFLNAFQLTASYVRPTFLTSSYISSSFITGNITTRDRDSGGKSYFKGDLFVGGTAYNDLSTTLQLSVDRISIAGDIVLGSAIDPTIAVVNNTRHLGFRNNASTVVPLRFDGNTEITGNVTIGASAINAGVSKSNTLTLTKATAANYDGIRYTYLAAANFWDTYIDSNAHFSIRYNGGANGGYIANNADIGSIDFTGQHRCKQQDDGENFNNKIGLIVVASGEYNNLTNQFEQININESIPKISLSNARKQKNVFGVISSKEDANNERKYAIGSFVSTFEKQIEDNRIIINSLGEGAIWICNINGNLQNGDYITTCEISGYGMKQDDDLLHNYTVAKITTDCNFDLNSDIYECAEFQFNGSTYRKAFVGCTYHCG